jgi:hypothetical protein
MSQALPLGLPCACMCWRACSGMSRGQSAGACHDVAAGVAGAAHRHACRRRRRRPLRRRRPAARACAGGAGSGCAATALRTARRVWPPPPCAAPGPSAAQRLGSGPGRPVGIFTAEAEAAALLRLAGGVRWGSLRVTRKWPGCGLRALPALSLSLPLSLSGARAEVCPRPTLRHGDHPGNAPAGPDPALRIAHVETGLRRGVTPRGDSGRWARHCAHGLTADLASKGGRGDSGSVASYRHGWSGSGVSAACRMQSCISCG